MGKRLTQIGRLLGMVAIATAVSVGFSMFQSQLGISWGTVTLVLAVAGYFEIRLTRLREQVGTENLQTLGEILDFEPITPRHEPSDGLAPTGWAITEHTHAFFADFEPFADVFNDYLERLDSRWRLQQVAETEVSTHLDDSPRPGRRYKIFYGPKEAGQVSISDGWEYSAERPEVHTVVELNAARRFHGSSVVGLLDAFQYMLGGAEKIRKEPVGDLFGESPNLSDGDREVLNVVRYHQAAQAIRNQMIEQLWSIGTEAVSESDLDISFTGMADQYLRFAQKT